MAMIAEIKRMYFREKLSVSEIGRRTSLSRNTIKKRLKEPGAEPKYRRNRTDASFPNSNPICAWRWRRTHTAPNEIVVPHSCSSTPSARMDSTAAIRA